MTFTYNGEKFEIQFDYAIVDDARCVACRVSHTEYDFNFGTGWARCVEGDQFVKETGRKIALTRALKKHDKAFRTAAWNAYHGRKQNSVKGAAQ